MIKAYALTDVGKCRSMNQDYVFCTTKQIGRLPNLFIVADGMGGHKAGDMASKFSVNTFVEQVQNAGSDNPITIISDAIKYTNAKLLELAATSEDYTGMGTTFVAATVIGRSVYVANIGDSRLYVFDGELRQVTRDHSLVEEMVNNGTIDREEARTHARKNVITRAMGGNAEVLADFFEVELTDGETIFMCSDGLSNMVDDSQIASVLGEDCDIIYKAKTLVNIADENGGKDNISLVIIEP
ncbi:MAG: Stp1/IreP family PP2C-type Ser/Thr phosphatase [Butyrivibrio sp.]